MTVSGTEVSLAAGESDVVVGGSTEALGPFITAGFGHGGNGVGVQVFTGGAGRRWDWGWGRRWRDVGLVWMAGWGAGVGL